MKRTRKGAAVLFLAAVLTLGQPSLGKLYGDTSALTAYTTERTEDKNWYVHTFTGGGSFLTSVNQGTITSRPGECDCSRRVYSGRGRVCERADVSETDGGTLYRFSEAGDVLHRDYGSGCRGKEPVRKVLFHHSVLAGDLGSAGGNFTGFGRTALPGGETPGRRQLHHNHSGGGCAPKTCVGDSGRGYGGGCAPQWQEHGLPERRSAAGAGFL